MIPDLTVLMPTSSIPCHPDTSKIKQTVASLRAQPVIGDARLLIMVDGLAPQHQSPARTATYVEYRERLVSLASEWGAEILDFSDRHRHQLAMTRSALDRVDTSILLFLEHDWLLEGIGDSDPMDWSGAMAAMRSGELDYLRLYWGTDLEPAHCHMMLDHEPIAIGGYPVMRTWQWSQNPHLALTDFYRRVLSEIDYDRPTMIEDVLHGHIAAHRIDTGDPAATWNRYRLCISVDGWPDRSISRVNHTDGREQEPVFDPAWGAT